MPNSPLIEKTPKVTMPKLIISGRHDLDYSLMPYKSQAQRRWAHTAAGKKALGMRSIKEFDAASKGKKLPERKGRGKDKY